MSIIRGLFGFVIGTAVGGAILTVAVGPTPNQVPSDVVQEQPQAEETPDESIETEATEINESAPENVEIEQEEVEETSSQEVDTSNTEETAKIEEIEPAVEEEPVSQEVEQETVEPEPVATPEPETPAVAEPEVAISEPEPVPQSPETGTQSTLPTIDPEEPPAAPETQEGITIGKKPKSSLPSIQEPTPEPIEPEVQEAPISTGALEINAVEFEGSDLPLMAIILEDIGDEGLSIEQLKSLNARMTIAVRTDDPNASERALEFSAAGFEVIAMASDNPSDKLNQARNSEDVSNALNVLFTDIPNSIGLLDGLNAGIQKNGRTSGAIVDIFASTGHGLVTYAKGLNSADRDASASGVRTGKVARVLDQNGEEKPLMQRYLDRLALDAGRDGAVLVLGTTSKETVATVAGWFLGSRGLSVTLAPASAVLLGK